MPESAYGFEHYLGLMVLTVLGGVLLCCAIALVAGYSARARARHRADRAGQGLRGRQRGVLRRPAASRADGRSSPARIIAKSVLSVVLVALALWLTGSAIIAAVALGLSWAVVLFLFDTHAYRRESSG